MWDWLNVYRAFAGALTAQIILCRVPVAGSARRAADSAAGGEPAAGSGRGVWQRWSWALHFLDECHVESSEPCAGFLSPASRGALLTALLVVYLLLAVGAGFGSVWLWGMIQRSYDGWTGVAWRCAAYFPGITLAAMSGLNVLLVHTGSSGAIPLGAFFSLIALWFLISIPLCFSGAPIPLDTSLLQ